MAWKSPALSKPTARPSAAKPGMRHSQWTGGVARASDRSPAHPNAQANTSRKRRLLRARIAADT